MAIRSLIQPNSTRYIAIPQDHGSWVFLLSPLLIGIFAGGRWTPAMVYLVLAALAAFLLRQPVVIAIKAYSGRRPSAELPAARFWILVYSAVGLAAVAGLVSSGFNYLLWLALPGLPVFAWHLVLVSRRQERRQMGIELVAAGALALAAPAGYWIGQESPDPAGWWLMGCTWFQSAASIVYAYLRLEQRELSEIPDLVMRLKMGWRALAYTTFNLAASLACAGFGWLPLLIPLPYLLQWLETLQGVVRPAIKLKPTSIGIRQLVVSTIFTLLFILAWNPTL